MGKQSRLRRERKKVGFAKTEPVVEKAANTTFAKREKPIPYQITVHHGFIDSEWSETIWRAEDWKGEIGCLEARVVAVGDGAVDLHLIEWLIGCGGGSVTYMEGIPIDQLKQVLEKEMRQLFEDEDYYLPVFEERISKSYQGDLFEIKDFIRNYINKLRDTENLASVTERHA